MAQLRAFVHTQKLIFLLLLATFLLTAVSYGQVDTGAITGTVTDQSGAVVPGAKVMLTNEGTGFSTSTLTGSEGIYTFSPVKIGTYSVAVELAGFQRTTRSHIQVNIQQHVVVDVSLKPGTVTQTIEVLAPPPLLQTESAAVGQVVGSRAINDLPLNGRNYVFLAQLSAGVTVGQQDNLGNSEGGAVVANGSFSANGTRPSQTNYMLDGIDNNNTQPDAQAGTWYSIRPPIDAVQEFKVQTSNYSAEIGRAGGAVLNATLKSGTNNLHGDLWEFVRNDKFDAADFFENASNIQKGEYRQNQFGLTLGGPLTIPKIYSGKNKTFFFVDYEGIRIRQGRTQVATVPTVAERNSGYTDFSDLIAGQSGMTPPDLLGRRFALGTIFDPATTRTVTGGQMDPVTGLIATGTGFVRDSFSGNMIPAGRLDANAIRLLNLYPSPTSGGLFDNLTVNPPVKTDGNSGDARIDENLSERDQMFLRFSYNHAATFNPPPFEGVAEGGDSFAGTFGVTASSAVWSETHSFSPNMINEFRIGFTRFASQSAHPLADSTGIPQAFGIQGIPQGPGNGGLPELVIGGLNQLGNAGFNPSYKISNVWNIRENLTKIQGKHSFKAGFEHEFVFIPVLVPQHARGRFVFNGVYTSIPGKNLGSTGRAQFLLTPIPATVPNGIDRVGGANVVVASDTIRTTTIEKYYGAFFQDDWRVTRKLTLNLGLRYDYASPYEDRYDNLANWLPGAPFAGAQYLYPADHTRQNNPPLSPGFLQALQKDGIAFVSTNNVAGVARKNDFAPRVGFAYQFRPTWVVRGGYGIFFGGLENSAGVNHFGSFNYPFLFSFRFPTPNPGHPITPDNSIGLLENGLLNVPINSALVSHGFNAVARQFRYPTPYYQGSNFSFEHQLTANQLVSIGYVGTFGRHLETPNYANVDTQILPPLLDAQDFVPYPDFASGFRYVTYGANSYFHSLQFTYERKFSAGLNFLSNYTWSRCRSDGKDLFTTNTGDFRAPGIPGFGIQGDYGPCEFDVRQVAHFSGTYELPVGKNKHFLSKGAGVLNALIGGWSVNWILTLQDGQPFTVPCVTTPAAGVGCYALLVPGQNPIGGKHNVDQWMNPLAFADPPEANSIGQTDLSPLGGAPGQVAGPGFHRLDFSLFKQFAISESKRLEFRAEFFNITNTPSFSLPTDNLDFTSPVFGKIDSTRDNPNDPREIQFALKFYF